MDGKSCLIQRDKVSLEIIELGGHEGKTEENANFRIDEISVDKRWRIILFAHCSRDRGGGGGWMVCDTGARCSNKETSKCFSCLV